MQFSSAAHDPELLELMTRVFDDVCRELGCASASDAYSDAAQSMMALRIMTAVAGGERDPERLKHFVLQAFDRREAP